MGRSEPATQRLTVEDVEALALGAAVLGSGGGGRTALAATWLRESLRRAGDVEILVRSDMSASISLFPVGIVGAVSVMQEVLPSGEETVAAVRRMSEQTGTAPSGLLPLEIGGQNVLATAVTAALCGLPLVDGDLMGRALPGLDQFSTAASGAALTPAVLRTTSGMSLLLEGADAEATERVLRVMMSRSEGWSALCLPPITSTESYDHSVIDGSVSRSLSIGRGLLRRRRGEVELSDLLAEWDGADLGAGRVIAIRRRSGRDAATSSVTLQVVDDASHGEDDSGDSTMRLEMGTEFLLVLLDGEVVATVPDIICVFDARSYAPLDSESLRVGAHVRVAVLPAAPFWLHPDHLHAVDPRAFGLGTEPVLCR